MTEKKRKNLVLAARLIKAVLGSSGFMAIANDHKWTGIIILGIAAAAVEIIDIYGKNVEITNTDFPGATNL